MKFDRRLVSNFDWFLLLITIIIATIGIFNIYSATFAGKEPGGMPIYLKQVCWIVVGIFVMFLSFCVDYRLLERFAYPLFTVAVLLLILVIPFGKSVSGSRRWLELGGFSLQPSEFFKIAIIFILSKYFSKYPGYSLGAIRGLFIPFLMLALPVVLVLLQPDLGTALIIILIFLSLLLFNGIKMKNILIMSSVFLAGLPLFWHYLKSYQKMRILTFVNPDLDPLGSGYHIIQSKIAIGSGAFWGKGFLKGTQSRLLFLPEQHTDFVFSVFAEEWGFLGSLMVVSLYLLVVLWGFRIASHSREGFCAFLTFGIVSMFFWQIFINIGMSLGIIPVVGVPLPLMSYGGSSTISFLLGIGILINISTRRFLF
ncbi:MAG: rod shape-determining protein RodA [Deltaproteobacteria bacterium CG_4_9_14_3_um_filter_44_9]|nr:MAG: rod shape-determining protein RodA [Deltaproteobacteria bacterium CG_4_9_14_3_um_filter_44_9]